MIRVLCAAGLLALLAFQTTAQADDSHDCDLDYRVQSIDGKEVDLEDFEGKVVVVVNVASKCGATPQYADLQAMYEKYKDKGLVVLGFPSNQFGKQEPGSNAEIKEFCSTNYQVTFPMFSKIDVKGDDANPFYKNLTSKDAKPAGAGPVGWNFEKFIINRDGQVAGRFKTRTKPTDPAFIAAVEKELAE
ncbi:glutathione peroxidase [Roseimaritima ulvae]|uniref:Glutathione peroxidase n=1 Tax=Roseimaritima ulvae TaxID=980254 RepID=A0A5B9QSW3_9BACT|nr:glutathione peroxidase [Roseimaritima ulvae]QEG42094.1 Hydroperoxy fatty acid reductase gpx1 [Roseimaritima ulvae]